MAAMHVALPSTIKFHHSSGNSIIKIPGTTSIKSYVKKKEQHKMIASGKIEKKIKHKNYEWQNQRSNGFPLPDAPISGPALLPHSLKSNYRPDSLSLSLSPTSYCFFKKVNRSPVTGANVTPPPIIIQANFSNQENVLPHIQTLRRYPVEEISSKLVMVRFDSSIMIQQVMERQAPLNASAFLTIKHVYNAGARVILTSSWNVKNNSVVLSVEAVAELLSSVLQLSVVPTKSISELQQLKMEILPNSDILLFDNLSSYKQERANDFDFSGKLASGIDIFVNDSFSSAHKIFASTVGVTQFSYASIAGFHLEECLYKLRKITDCNKIPYVAVIGGGNITDKAAALRLLASFCDGLVFVGMMAFQIMHALGVPFPSNLSENGGSNEALDIVQLAKCRNIPIVVPKDFWCKHTNCQVPLETFLSHDIDDGWEPVDLGPDSMDEIASFLSRCKKIMWIGPLKFKQLDQNIDGASKLALILDNLSQRDCDITVAGHMACQAIMRISKSASAYIMIENASVVWEFLKGRNLPGVVALDRAYPFPIDWKMIYSDVSQPLAVDIGSGNGIFLMGMASLRKDLNFLGLEINEKLLTRCMDSLHQAGLKNLHFIATNATSTFHNIVSSYPGPLVLVSIQCPNPDFNEPEHRWKMLRRSLVEAIADLLASGGQVFLQSDVKEVALRMRKQFLEDGKGKLAILEDEGNGTPASPVSWLKDNPFGVESDWERHVNARGAPMYRLMFYKR